MQLHEHIRHQKYCSIHKFISQLTVDPTQDHIRLNSRFNHIKQQTAKIGRKLEIFRQKFVSVKSPRDA